MLDTPEAEDTPLIHYAVRMSSVTSINTLEFLQKILPEHGVHYLALFKEGYKFPAHKVYTDLETMADAITNMAKSNQLSVYHACASYQKAVIESDELDKNGNPKRKYRVPENWDRAKAFWVDIDCGEAKHAKGDGYLTKKEAVVAIIKFADTIGWDRPMVVDSGNGIHAYWPLTKDISHTNWVKIAKDLKATLHHCGVIADPTRTADFASILRPAGSINRKNGEAKPVFVVSPGTVSDPDELEAKLQEFISRACSTELGKSEFRAYKASLNDDLTVHLKRPEGQESIDLVRSALIHLNPGMSREHWLTVVWAIRHGLGDTPEALELADQWSKGALNA